MPNKSLVISANKELTELFVAHFKYKFYQKLLKNSISLNEKIPYAIFRREMGRSLAMNKRQSNLLLNILKDGEVVSLNSDGFTIIDKNFFKEVNQ